MKTISTNEMKSVVGGVRTQTMSGVNNCPEWPNPWCRQGSRKGKIILSRP